MIPSLRIRSETEFRFVTTPLLTSSETNEWIEDQNQAEFLV
ncbi:hypothetical protein LEP1GSC059_4317 [Leptospira noguchii serovar Panama str. CZ214]|uniref:Uncharacterized protein n=1 Tax=Leptospira noguchii serovar Panama str. CZ214 TaxID=1001595 RepID=T0GTK7_9LEPT|nr:hypothetical protein LEP1GSC059_4317 [Leptospira noguchii serovar Panama str. CZ214]